MISVFTVAAATVGLISTLLLAACPGPGGGQPTPPDTRAVELPDVEGLPGFEIAEGCRLPPDPAGEGSVRIVDAFPELPNLAAPIDLEPLGDGSGRLFVAERAGVVRLLADDRAATSSSVYLDLSSKVHTAFECGLLGLAAHPDYADNGWLFTSYCTRVGGQTYSVISRWSRSADDPTRADADSEHELLRLRQPWDNHNGGPIAFGPDGRLYIGFGDGGAGDDPLGSGQDTSTWLGTILRVDVDDVPAGERYGIPQDNPFAGGGASGAGGAPEIYAWGLRNPWRMGFDPVTGQLWVGDVGQNAVEEIDLVERGKNYGWKIMEGSRCRPGGPNSCDRTGLTLPVAEYGHDLGNSVTGGYVYRGTAAPSLYGAYLYADFGSSVLFAYRHGEAAPPTAPMMTTPTAIASFGQAEDGEVFLLGLMNGRIYRLEERAEEEGGATGPPVPSRLSETGCFDATSTLEAAKGVLPYELNVPFWSDGALKRRWVVVPAVGSVGYTATGAWSFAPGTVFVKHFELETKPGDASSRIPVETRLLAVDEEGVRGYSYRWDEDGTDATLLAGADERTVDVGGEPLRWTFPSRLQCRSCHTPASGGVLGLETAQLDRDVRYGAGAPGSQPVSQIDAWRAWGLFADAPDGTFDGSRALTRPGDIEASPDDRARSWLHVNCASCHRPGGPSGTGADLRITTSVSEAGVCDVGPARGDLGIADARLLAPGDPDRSLLLQRLTASAAHRMPPIGNERADPDGLAAVRAWIEALEGCPGG